jgi:hypothetical protein
MNNYFKALLLIAITASFARAELEIQSQLLLDLSDPELLKELGEQITGIVPISETDNIYAVTNYDNMTIFKDGELQTTTSGNMSFNTIACHNRICLGGGHSYTQDSSYLDHLRLIKEEEGEFQEVASFTGNMEDNFFPSAPTYIAALEGSSYFLVIYSHDRHSPPRRLDANDVESYVQLEMEHEMEEDYEYRVKRKAYPMVTSFAMIHHSKYFLLNTYGDEHSNLIIADFSSMESVKELSTSIHINSVAYMSYDNTQLFAGGSYEKIALLSTENGATLGEITISNQGDPVLEAYPYTNILLALTSQRLLIFQISQDLELQDAIRFEATNIFTQATTVDHAYNRREMSIRLDKSSQKLFIFSDELKKLETWTFPLEEGYENKACSYDANIPNSFVSKGCATCSNNAEKEGEFCVNKNNQFEESEYYGDFGNLEFEGEKFEFDDEAALDIMKERDENRRTDSDGLMDLIRFLRILGIIVILGILVGVLICYCTGRNKNVNRQTAGQTGVNGQGNGTQIERIDKVEVEQNRGGSNFGKLPNLSKGN